MKHHYTIVTLILVSLAVAGVLAACGPAETYRPQVPYATFEHNGAEYEVSADYQEGTWQDGVDYCVAMGNGWRLPTLDEAKAMRDGYSGNDPLGVSGQPDWCMPGFRALWTSTECDEVSGGAAFVYPLTTALCDDYVPIMTCRDRHFDGVSGENWCCLRKSGYSVYHVCPQARCIRRIVAEPTDTPVPTDTPQPTSTPTAVPAPPVKPYSPWGEVLVDGQLAEDGLLVEGIIDGTVRDAAETVLGWYSLDISDGEPGDVVTFAVEGRRASLQNPNNPAVWESGVSERIDISVAFLTKTPTSTDTPANTPIPTDTPTPTATNTPEPTSTPTATATSTPAPTDTPEPTVTRTPVPTATETPCPTSTPTQTPRPTVATDTPQPTATATQTATPTSTRTPRPTATLTETPRPTVTSSPTVVSTATSTNTPRPTSTNTPWPTATLTNTPEPTDTPVPTATPEPTATDTPPPTSTPTPTVVGTPTETPIPTESCVCPDGSTWWCECNTDADCANCPPGYVCLQRYGWDPCVYLRPTDTPTVPSPLPTPTRVSPLPTSPIPTPPTSPLPAPTPTPGPEPGGECLNAVLVMLAGMAFGAGGSQALAWWLKKR